MKLGLTLAAIAVFSILGSHLAAKRQTAAPVPLIGAPAKMLTSGARAVAVSRLGLPIPVAQHREELERFVQLEAQKAVNRIRGEAPWPHGTYTIPAGTKCEVLSQRGELVEVMWIDGPMIQAGAWIHSGNLKEEP